MNTSTAQQLTADISDLIDPLIGTGRGQCPPGPFLPFGVCHPSPDTIQPNSTSGYQPNQAIQHFSMLHVSGTGGGGRYGNVGLMPGIEPVNESPPPQSPCNEYSSIGHYHVNLQPSDINVDIYASHHGSLHKYSFNQNKESYVFINASAVIRTYNEVPEDTGSCIGGYLQQLPTGEFIGRGDFQGGYGHPFSYSIYFAIAFDQTPGKTTFINDKGHINEKTNYRMHGNIGLKHAIEGPNCKAICHFPGACDVTVRVGISFVSVAQARFHLADEISNKSPQDLKTLARSKWKKCFGGFSLDGGNRDLSKLVNTMMYRLHTLPKECGINHENPFWKSGIPHYTDFYCLWDSARNAIGFFCLTKPDLVRKWTNCLIDIADHTGWLPDSWIAFQHSFLQGGNSGDTVLAETLLRNIPGIDSKKALQYVAKNALVTSPDTFLYGRHQQINDSQGYLSTDCPMACVSRHIEYTYQDWSLAAIAHIAGDNHLKNIGLKGTSRLWNLWRSDLKCFAPKTANGEWISPIDPTARGKGWKDPYFYEGSAQLWSLHAFQDIPELIQRHGGKKQFCRHLDQIFKRPREQGGWHPKDFQLHIPWLYIHAGQADKLATLLPSLLKKHYSTGRNLPDDEDMGCQSTWVICVSVGIYPLMGQPIWYLHTPQFQNIHLPIEDGARDLHITCDYPPAPHPFIKQIFIDGIPLNRSWCWHYELFKAQELRFSLSQSPCDFGTNALPPGGIDILKNNLI